MFVRKLSAQLQLKSELELNEVPSRVKDDIDAIKTWMKQHPHLKARTEDQWILSFLRGCKFSLERTKNKLIKYYGMRLVEPEFFAERDPFNPELQKLLKTGFCLPLRKLTDSAAPRILLLQNRGSEEVSVINMIRIMFMIFDILFNEDDNFCVAGQIILQDFKCVTLHHALEITPTRAQNLMNCLQHAYPTRPKKFHFINTPTFFPTLYSLVKHFMTDKIKSRINLYPDGNMDDLYKSIPKSVLPKEYGGEAGPIQDLIDYWKHQVENYQEWFLQDQEYICTSSIQFQDGNNMCNDGVVGSFRKLAID